MTQRFTRDGSQAEVAPNGQEALTACQRQAYTQILGDLWMPVFDGQGLYEAPQRCQPQLCARVVLLTGDILTPAVHAFLARIQRAPARQTVYSGAAPRPAHGALRPPQARMRGPPGGDVCDAGGPAAPLADADVWGVRGDGPPRPTVGSRACHQGRCRDDLCLDKGHVLLRGDDR